MRRLPWQLWLTLGVLVVAGACAKNAPNTDPRAGDEDDDPFEPWEEVLEDTEPFSSLMTLHLKRDNTVYLEIPTAVLDARRSPPSARSGSAPR